MKEYAVMIVDDDEVDRYLLTRALNKLEFSLTIFESENGVQALEFLSAYEENKEKHGDNFPPILIFLDINMPLMGGFEFLEAFAQLKKQDQRYSSSIFTMFTSSEKEDDKKRAAQYDFVKGFLLKGEVTTEALNQVFAKHFDT